MGVLDPIRPSLPLKAIDRLATTLPTDATEARALHHLERYWFVAERLASAQRLQVLDLGCGEALGIREFFKLQVDIERVVGIDLEPEACNCETIVDSRFALLGGNIETVALEEQFDVVICFETLGFGTFSSDERLLDRMDQWCAPGGFVFLSAPNYWKGSKNAHLQRTYLSHEFRRLVDKCWPPRRIQVEFFGQTYPLNRDPSTSPFHALGPQSAFSIAVGQKVSDT